ncbi:MAG: hypothetical protein LQ350_001711 [Teloschistes chrysophthalmus]|nr:MAG: hypothetical protein LQ350_001711 [Niorma chrysophthalma]
MQICRLFFALCERMCNVWNDYVRSESIIFDHQPGCFISARLLRVPLHISKSPHTGGPRTTSKRAQNIEASRKGREEERSGTECHRLPLRAPPNSDAKHDGGSLERNFKILDIGLSPPD